MGKSVKALVAVTNDLYTDQRVDKICQFLHSRGYEVLLIGRKLKNSPRLSKRVYSTHRMRLFFVRKVFFYAEYNIRLFLFLMFHRVHLIVSNDLDTLLACYLAHRVKPNTRLVYDSHEYFTGVPELTDRSAQKVWEKLENYLFPRLKAVYTVNRSIAELYEQKYGKKVDIVRNIAPFWDSSTVNITRSELNLPTDKPLLIIQGNGINIDRGAEEAVQAMHLIDCAYLIIVGHGDVIPKLKKYVQEHDLSEKVRFFGRQSYQNMMYYTYHATIGLSLDKNTNNNYKFSLPNKIFDYIQAHTPIIYSPMIEVQRIMDDYPVGLPISTISPDIIAELVHKLLDDTQLYNQLKENCKRASTELTWEKETQVLAQIYPHVTSDYA